MVKIDAMTANDIVYKVKNRELTAEESVNLFFDRITEVEDKIHSFVTLLKEKASAKAREIDVKVRKGEKLGRLAGVPVALKDNLCTRGVPTTCSSRMLKDFIPPYDATVVERLEAEDAVIIGKSNMDEFAMGTTTETSYFGPTRNPWDLRRVAGGSSGGSAAAVSASEAALALGSDTGGSVRCPASFCSVVGLKPTYGRVSRYGLIAYANSLEQIGPIAKNASDCALLFDIISGHDPRDSTSIPIQEEDTLQATSQIGDLKIGVPREFFGEGTERKVSKRVWEAVYTLESLGCKYEETSLPSLEYALSAYYILAMSEASSNLARYDGVRYGFCVEDEDANWAKVFAENRRGGFGSEVRRRIILGTYALSAGYFNRYYLKALKVRTLIREDFERLFKRYDILATPTMPVTPFNIGEKIEDPLELYMCDVDTVTPNLAGIPALSIPCGFKDGLPIGLQLIGPPFSENKLLRIAEIYQENTYFHKEQPLLRGS